MLEFKFLTKQEAVDEIIKNDEFIQKINKSNILYITGQDWSKDQFVEHLKTTTEDFTDEEIDIINHIGEGLKNFVNDNSLTEKYEIPVLNFAKVNGQDSFTVPYTRGNTIYLPSVGALHYLIPHEFFHVLSRSNPELKNKLYPLFDYKKTGIKSNFDFDDRIIVNPDAANFDYGVKISSPAIFTNDKWKQVLSESDFESKEVLIVPVFNVKGGAQVDNFGEISLGKCAMLIDGEMVNTLDDNLFNFSLKDFTDLTGGNTGYIVHPEELSADHFYFLVANHKPKNKELLEHFKNRILE